MSDIVTREEGWTPAIVGAIRAALAFQLSAAVGYDNIIALENAITRRPVAALRSHPQLVVLGNLAAERLPIVSFLVRCGPGYLHHNLVVALLSDLFGIQARGGCSCAGPYGKALLDIDDEIERAFEREVLAGRLGIKPGWVRIGFSFFMSEHELDYLLRAVQWIADHGQRLLDDYLFDPDSGEWCHRRALAGHPPLAQLAAPDYSSGSMRYQSWEESQSELSLAEHLMQATQLLARPARERSAVMQLPASFEALLLCPERPTPGSHKRARVRRAFVPRPAQAEAALRRIIKSHKAPRFSWHTLRRTCGALVACTPQIGPPWANQDQLGSQDT